MAIGEERARNRCQPRRRKQTEGGKDGGDISRGKRGEEKASVVSKNNVGYVEKKSPETSSKRAKGLMHSVTKHCRGFLGTIILTYTQKVSSSQSRSFVQFWAQYSTNPIRHFFSI